MDLSTAVADITVAQETADPERMNTLAERSARQVAGASTVALVTRPTLTTIASILGSMRAGAVVVPISADAGPLEIDHILRDSCADMLIDGESSRALAPTGRRTVVEDMTLLMYTSGTTGAPKGVPITSRAIGACLEGLYDAWTWTPDDTLVHGLPLHHVHGLVLGLLGAVARGCPLIHTKPTPVAYAQAGGTLYFGVPTIWSRVARDSASARALASARLLVSGSAALPAGVCDALATLCGTAPVERYGMTETLITVSARADEPRQVGTVGRPLAGTRTRVVDDGGTPASTSALGELQVRGDSVFGGYLDSARATADVFTEDGWFRTGDAATIDDQGVHRIIGRISTDLIKCGGYRIGAGEVEDALALHPAVRECAVVGVPDDDLGQRIVAFVVSDPVGADVLIDHVASQLSWHKRPRDVVFVDVLPRNSMGKVEKTSLRDAFAAGA